MPSSISRSTWRGKGVINDGESAMPTAGRRAQRNVFSLTIEDAPNIAPSLSPCLPRCPSLRRPLCDRARGANFCGSEAEPAGGANRRIRIIVVVMLQKPAPQESRLRLLGRWPGSACLAVCCDCVCPVAHVLLLAVFALSRLYCCSLSLCDCGPGRNFQCDRIGSCAPAPVMSSISTSCCAWPAFFDQFALEPFYYT